MAPSQNDLVCVRMIRQARDPTNVAARSMIWGIIPRLHSYP
jgi:hypothetical protein